MLLTKAYYSYDILGNEVRRYYDICWNYHIWSPIWIGLSFRVVATITQSVYYEQL
jgi:hypothetical protein